VVEWTNLPRQVLFDEADARLGVPKAEAAREKLARVNSGVAVRAVVADLGAGEGERLLGLAGGGGLDVILDGTDNFRTRYVLNDIAVKHGVPLVYAGVVGTRGTTMVVRPGLGPCLRCVEPELPAPGTFETCDTVGVLGPAVAVVAGLASASAVRLLAGDAGEAALVEVDAWTGGWRTLRPRRDPGCPCCGQRRFEFLDAGDEASAVLCGRESVQLAPPASGGVRIDLAALASRLAAHGRFEVTRYLLRGTLSRERGDGESAIGLTVFPDARAIVTGTTRPERARAIYARYVGV
ncbi:MAG: ThiF family adenylyltransferase, partial [Phycisphaerales bacterium]|nr:ThiF family adenylyltransferase [Phycisphaerales bacterium]